MKPPKKKGTEKKLTLKSVTGSSGPEAEARLAQGFDYLMELVRKRRKKLAEGK